MKHFLQRFQTKASRTQAMGCARPIAYIADWTLAAPTRAYETKVRDGYQSNPVVQRAVRLIADGVASIAWTLPEDSDALAALLQRPNPRQSRAEFLEAVVLSLQLHGNAYVEVATNGAGAPAELHVLRPERVSVVAGGHCWPAAYEYRAGGQAVRFPVDGETGACDLLHIRAAHPLDDHFGLAPLDAAADAIDVHNASIRWNRGLLQNAARPSGALVFQPAAGEPNLSPEQFDRLKAEMEENFQGALNAGRPLLLEGGLTWQPLSLTPADMDFIEAKASAARDIALAFGVPPMLLGLPGDNTYSNYREANRALWRMTILPLAAKIGGALGQHLAQWWPAAELRIDEEQVPALAQDREALWSHVSQADFLSADEKREILGVRTRS